MKKIFLALILLLLAGCSGGDSDDSEAPSSPIAPLNPEAINIIVSSVSVSPDGKKMIVNGFNLSKATSIAVLNAEKTQVIHALSVVSKTDSAIEAVPTGTNLELKDGLVLRVH